MNTTFTPLLHAAAGLLPACGGDSHAAVTDDVVGISTDLVEILEGIQDEDDLQAADAKIDRLMERMAALEERTQELAPLSPERERELQANMEKRLAALQPRMRAVMERMSKQPELLAEVSGIFSTLDFDGLAH